MAARRGTGSIHFDRPNNCYVGRVSLTDGSGKRIRPSVRAATRAEAQEKLRELQDQLRAGIRTSGSYTVRACVEDWLSTLSLADGTVEGKRSHAKTWVYPAVGTILIKDLTVADLDRLFAKMARERRHQTLVIVRSILRRSLRNAQKHDLILRNVAELVDLPAALAPRESRAMTIEQAGKVLKHTQGTRMHAVFVLSFTLALRPGELRSLRWSDINFDQRVIKVHRQLKNSWSERTLSVPQISVDALKLHREIREMERAQAGSEWISDGLVFCHEDGRAYSKESLRWRWVRVTRECGLGDWHPHEGRHTGVSILDDRGVPLQEIADFVGHRTKRTTENVYRHIIRPQIRGGVDVMDAVFA